MPKVIHRKVNSVRQPIGANWRVDLPARSIVYAPSAFGNGTIWRDGAVYRRNFDEGDCEYTFVDGEGGTNFDTAGTDDVMAWNPSQWVTGFLGELSLIARASFDETSGFQQLMSVGGAADPESTNYLYIIGVNGGNPSYFHEFGPGTNAGPADADNAIASGTIVTIGIKRTASGLIRFFTNGRKNGADKGPFTLPTGGTSATLNVGGGYNGGSPTQGTNGRIMLCAAIPRAMPDEWFLRHTSNPWQMFYKERRVFVPDAADPGGFNAAFARGSNVILGAGL